MAEYIKLEDAVEAIRANGIYGSGHSDDERENDVINTLEAVPAADVVSKSENDTLKQLINGKWVDCDAVQKALGIDFATGMKMFDFSREAEWNPKPLNGQKITTKFRLRNSVVRGRWVDHMVRDWRCSECCEKINKVRNVDGYCYDDLPNYCPNCGARMDATDTNVGSKGGTHE